MPLDYDHTGKVAFNCPKCSRRAWGTVGDGGVISVHKHYIRLPHCSYDRTEPVACIFSGNHFETWYLDRNLLDLQDIVSVPTHCSKGCDIKGVLMELRNVEALAFDWDRLRWHLCAWKVVPRTFKAADIKPVPLDLPKDSKAFNILYDY